MDLIAATYRVYPMGRPVIHLSLNRNGRCRLAVSFVVGEATNASTKEFQVADPSDGTAAAREIFAWAYGGTPDSILTRSEFHDIGTVFANVAGAR